MSPLFAFVLALGAQMDGLGVGARGASLADAHRHYRDGRYREAARLYERVLAERPSADVAFNLGNAFAKAGDLARARAAFENALRLRPRDADAKANLAFVLKEMERVLWAGDETRDEVSPFWVNFPLRFSAVESEILLVAGSYLFFGCLIAHRLARRRGARIGFLYASLVTFVLFLGALGIWGARAFATDWNRAAVVVAPQTTVRLGPSEKEDAIAVVRPGRKLRVTQVRAGWYRVPWPGGLSGFVRRTDVVELL